MTEAECNIISFDSHVHLDMMAQKGVDADGAIRQAFDSGVVGMIAITNPTETDSLAFTLPLVGSIENLWHASGIHPHSASSTNQDRLDRLCHAMDHNKTVALGEIGLDYHYNFSTPSQQRSAFAKQIRLAHRFEKPIIVHTRNADDDTIAILQDEGAEQVGGVIHCFSAGEKLAAQALALGFYISFSGIVTFPNAKEVADAVALVPDNRILAETDAPFLSPVPYRGKLNEPARVITVTKKLASLRKLTDSEMGETLVKNTSDCFGLGL